MEGPKANVLKIGQMELRFIVDETNGPGSLVAFEFCVPANGRVPAPHFHRDVDEMVYGLEGTLTSTVNGTKHEIRPGESLFIPRGSVHHHANLHDAPVRVLTVLTPGSIGRRYFEDIAAEVNVTGKPDLGRIKDVMLRHGLVPA